MSKQKFIYWKIKELRSVCHLAGGYGFPEHFQGGQEGDIPFIKVSDMSLSENKRNIVTANNYVDPCLAYSLGWTPFPVGSVVFAKVGAALKLNRRRILTKPTLIDNNMMAAMPSSCLDSSFLFHFLNSIDFSEFVQDGVLPSVNQKQVGSIALPDIPLFEQQKIAEILDTVDETIALTTSLIAKLKQIRAGLLHDLLTRGLDEDGKLRDAIAHPEQFKDSPLGRIPKDWEMRTCESVCKEIVVGIVIKPSQYYLADGVPVIRSANVREAGLNPSDLVFMSKQSNHLLAKSMIRTGDVLTVRTGYPGTSCVVPPEFDGANCVDIIISRPTTEIKPEFLATWINSNFGKSQVLRVQSGLAQQHFNVGQLQKLLFAKPSFEEQQAIQVILNAHDSRLRKEEAYLDKLKLQKKGLMHDLLTGRVRVNTSQQLSA